MKNTTLFLIAVVALALIGGFVFMGSGKGVTGNVVNEPPSGEVQKITLSMKNYNYYPQTIKVEAGKPVEITLDSSVVGCLRSFTIPEFGVRKLSKTPADKIIFTPDKKGTFAFSCSMGMAYGQIEVA